MAWPQWDTGGTLSVSGEREFRGLCLLLPALPLELTTSAHLRAPGVVRGSAESCWLAGPRWSRNFGWHWVSLSLQAGIIVRSSIYLEEEEKKNCQLLNEKTFPTAG